MIVRFLPYAPDKAPQVENSSQTFYLFLSIPTIDY